MGLPFMTVYNTGYRFNPTSYAMFSGDIGDSMGLSYSAKISDYKAKLGLNFFPTTTSNPFTSYSSMSMPFDTIAYQTINYFDQFSKQVGGPGLYDANGNINLAQPLFNGVYAGAGMGGFGGFGMMPGMGMGVMPGMASGMVPGVTSTWVNPFRTPQNNGAVNGVSGTPDTAKETKITKLKNLLNAYKAEASGLSDEVKSKINAAVAKTGSQDERLKALTDLYNEIGKEELKKTIPFVYEEELSNMGFKFDGTYSYYQDSVYATSVQSAIDDLGKNCTPAENVASVATNLISLISNLQIAEEGKSTGVLQVVSTWNDKTDKNIIKALTEYVTTKGNPDEYKTNVEIYVKPLVDALKNDVELYKKVAGNNNEFDKLDKLSKALTKSYTAVYNYYTDTNKINTLAENFDKLYVMLRRCEAKRIDEKIKSEYGFVDEIKSDDTNIITGMVSAATEADLKSEGLDEIDCTPSGLNENDTVEEQVAELCKGPNSYLTKQEVEVDETKVVLYWAKELNKVYTLGTDGKLYEVTNATINGDKVTLSEAPVLEDESVTPKSIENEINAKREAAEAAAQAEQEAQNAVNEAKDKGNQISTKLKEGKTDDAVSIAVGLTTDQTVDAIIAYNNHPNAKGRANKYFERLSNAGMTVAQIKTQVNGILAKAEKLGLKETDSYKKVKAIIEKYELGGVHNGSDNMDYRYKQKANKGKFWKVADKWENISISAGSGAAVGAAILAWTGPGAIAGALIGAVVGAIGGMAWGKVSDVEVLDEYVLELCKEIKAKENELN